MTTDTLHISLPDVALLARVQRPPVSMWLRRYAESSTPFPTPVTIRGTQAFFDGHQVVDWLETTGLGRNPDARADLAAFAALADIRADDDAVFAGLTALLCLSRFVDRLPTDAADIEDLADDVDPDDEFLFSEITGLSERVIPLARYAAMLIDAAYHAGAAFETLMSRRTHRPRSGHARTALAASARRLVASLALALGTHAEIATPLFVDPAPGSSDLLVELAGLAGESGAIAVATPPTSGPEGRLTRRRIRVHDIVREPLPRDGHGGFVVPDDAVLMMQFPAPDRPDLSDLEVLRAIEDLVLGSSATRRAVVIGPAGALTDRLRGPTAAVRDGILRTDRVRGIVRLPAGLLPGKPRSRLAVWCLGPVPSERDPKAAADGPRTLVADLADTTLDDAAIAELVTDLVAGMQDFQALRAHSPQFTRAVLTRTLIARVDDLVEPAPAPARAAAAAELVGRISALRAELAAPLTAPGLVTPLPRAVRPHPTITVGAALEGRELRVIPGLRIDPQHVDRAASVRVIGPPELGGGPDVRRVDRLVLAAAYPASRYTEPGDVVFCAAPRPAALVDIEGGSVVAFPARILRSRTARLSPQVLAADINAQPAAAKTWRGWSIRQVPDEQADALTGILNDLDRHRAALTGRLAVIDQLAAALVQGTAAGTLDLAPHS